MSPDLDPRHAVFPGTFDPFTLGHLDLVRRAAHLFDRVTVAVAEHHSKSALFGVEERLSLAEESLVAEDGSSLAGVHVAVLEGLLVEGCRALGAAAVVRGIRSAADLEYERAMALTNRAIAPEVETVLLMPAPEFGHISSTLVRQVARMGGDVTPFVPAPVVAALARQGHGS